MHKQALRITLYLVLAALLAPGCSSSRRSRTTDLSTIEGGSVTYEYSDIVKSNLSSQGFFIRKLRLNIDIDGTPQSYTANMRKSTEGEWLASVQLLRIEVLRVYADRENVIVLDRIGRKATVIGWERLKAEYGITYDLLPVIMGDIPELTRQSQRDLICNVPTSFRKGNLIYDLIVDCQVPRASEVILSVDSGSRIVKMRAEDFSTVGDVTFSKVVSVTERTGAFYIEMHIDDIVVPWNGEIEFSIPTNYTVERK